MNMNHPTFHLEWEMTAGSNDHFWFCLYSEEKQCCSLGLLSILDRVSLVSLTLSKTAFTDS